ncbi:MAG: DUF1801 domain-containing protein [Roseibium sp.]|uniref:DUF1801 domain-containing protein n=1 Tax=Roseibium sp. TaxID=1936156 RepID=UPI0026047EC3|nr:DUF1801 domain-containing protein [Roseibium sp.]MCV0425232.1 DUF1801 domain-containing protein [Roseibium sp.]
MFKSDPAVLAVMDSYSGELKEALLGLRALILKTAEEHENIGLLHEALKWGQPSYLTVQPKTGTTIRIDRDKSDLGDFALYVNCQSSLISDWRTLFPALTFGGDRSVHFKLNRPLPKSELRHMIAMALTYHSSKRNQSKNR